MLHTVYNLQANGVQTDLPFLFVKEEEGDEPVPPISFWMLANTLLTSLLKQPFLYFSRIHFKVLILKQLRFAHSIAGCSSCLKASCVFGCSNKSIRFYPIKIFWSLNTMLIRFVWTVDSKDQGSRRLNFFWKSEILRIDYCFVRQQWL